MFFKRSDNNTTELIYHNTQSQAMMHIRRPKANRIIFQSSMLFIGPKAYNCLPKDIRTSGTLKYIFGRKQKLVIRKKLC